MNRLTSGHGVLEAVLRIDQDLAYGDRFGNETCGLERLGGVVEDLLVLLAAVLLLLAGVLAVLLPQFQEQTGRLFVEFDAVRRAGVCLLDQFLGLEALDVALNAEQDVALLGVLLSIITFAIEADELRNVLFHVVVTRGSGRVELAAQDVERLEVQLRRVDPGAHLVVVDRHVTESLGGLLPMLRLEVGAAAGVLDLDVLLLSFFVALGRLDVANVTVERRDHAVLFFGELFRLELLGFALVALVALGTRRKVAAALAVRPVLVLHRVDVLVAEHRGERGFRCIGPVWVFRNDCVERRAALVPLLLEVQEVRHGVADLGNRRPVLLDDARELELVELLRREVVDHELVETFAGLHGRRIAGAADAAGADGFEVPSHRRFGHQRSGRVGTLELRRGRVLALLELLVDRQLPPKLLHDRQLVTRLRRHDRAGDLCLVEAVVVALVALDQVLVEDDRLRVMTGIDQVLSQILHHREGLVAVDPLVARQRTEERVGFLRAALEGVHRDDVAACAVGQPRGVRQLRVLHAELDDLLEVLDRLAVLAHVPFDVGDLVGGVAPKFVVWRWVLEHLLVEVGGDRPLAGVTLGFVEEQLAKREVGVRHEA